MRILYGVVGEGMGHATRSKVVVEHLRERGHEVKIVVSGRAIDFLRKAFPAGSGPPVSVVPIEGLTIRYAKGAMDRDLSVLRNVVLAPSMLARNAAAYFDDVRHFEPSLVFSDFDSYAYLFARRFGLPIVSIDNQQVIHKCKHPKAITEGARADYRMTRAFVKAKLPGCDHYVITYFCEPKVRPRFRDRVTLVPPILRREILETKPSRGDHVLVYQTSASDQRLLKELGKVRGQRFAVYGLRRGGKGEGAPPPVEAPPNCEVKAFSERGFVEDLASARAVVTNAGLSLVHEAVYLGKPLLCVPVVHQFEQEMNARYVEALGYGLSAARMDADVVRAFLDEEPKFARRVRRHRQDGNHRLFETVDRLVEELG